jgi:hypothetical protein
MQSTANWTPSRYERGAGFDDGGPTIVRGMEGKEVVLKNGDHPMNREKYTPDSGLAPLNANADSVLALNFGSLRFAGMTTFSNGEL